MSQELLFDACQKSLQLRGLDSDPKYKKRLKWEIEEIAARSKSSYFWSLYNNRTRYPQNQNNLLICWLLGIAPDHNIDQEPKCEYGEYPDIDVDYLPIVRDYLKTVWAKDTFGSEYVCNIGNYTTFGIKSALIDMARVHGESREEVQALTKNLDAKDDEGKVMTWDAAMKLYPELKKYCELDDNHKRIADAAKRLLHRNRGMGVHAGGLIIANAPLSDLVPLVKRKDSPQASAWVEGLHGQDLGPMGLVKFDLLVIANLLQIARCCEMVKKRHGLNGICNKPGEPDWTDVAAWRDDPTSLAMANIGDLKCIFQFDSEGMRGLVRAGGVDRFEDLVAYTALFRPGPLGMKMQERYVERKRGREKYTLHPLVHPILDKTYGVLTYQEQIMRILNVVGEIPLKDCELVRKAISKKKVEGFIKYKEMFVLNGQKNLGCNETEINHLWNQIEAFAEYGFNLSMTIGTLVPVRVCGETKTKRIEEFVPGDVVLCVNQAGDTVETQVVALHDHGVLPGYEVAFDDGYKVTCTLDHKFLTQKGQKSLREIIRTNSSILCDPKHKMESENAEEKYGWLEGSMRDELAVTGCDVDTHEGVCDLSREVVYDGGMGGMAAGHAEIRDTGRLVCRRIVRVMPVGERQMYDLEVANSTHNFLLPNGVVTSNSHAVAYTYISAWLLYLKAHFPHEFYVSMLSCETLSEKIKEYKMEAKIHGVDMNRLDINKSDVNFDLQGDIVYFGLSNIKGLGEAPAKRIVASQPYKSFEDFVTRFGTDASVLKPILGLRCFRDRDPVSLWKFAEHFKDCASKIEEKKKRYHVAMIKYDAEFKKLLPLEIRTLSQLENGLENGLENVFDSEGWKLQCYKDEQIEVDKEIQCKKDSPGATERIVVEDIEVEGTGLYLQREIIQYYHIGKVKKTWNLWKELRKLWQRRKKSIERYKNIERSSLPTLLDFDANAWDINEELMKEFRDSVACEEKYYGFAWIHDLERSPDYKGNLTFTDLKNSMDAVCGPVELRVKKVIKTASKKRKEFIYYQVLAEDVTGQENRINVWPDDWEWWHREFGWEEVGEKSKFTAGNLLRVRLQPPTGGFNTFTLESNQVGKWRSQKRYHDKADDPRVMVMQKGQKEEEKFLSDDEAMEQFTNCIMGQQ